VTLIATVIGGAPGITMAQSWSDQMRQGIKSSFRLPFEEFATGEHDSVARNVLSDFSVNAAFNYPLFRTTGDNGKSGHNSSLDVGIRYNPLSYWFGSVKFSGYADDDLQADFDPDFEYSFGYDDWHPWTFSLVYENSAGNRFNPDRPKGQVTSDFDQGTLAFGWKVRPSDRIQELFRFDDTSSVNCNIGITVSPEYYNARNNRQESWQEYLEAGCRYTIYKRWYVSLSARLYDGSEQNPWNPDYTWGFGYYDWRNGKLSVSYTNDAGNRFPWSAGIDSSTRFKDGTISISWNWQF